MTRFRSIAAAAALSLLAQAATASITIGVSETGGDTVFSLSGSIDTDSLGAANFYTSTPPSNISGFNRQVLVDPSPETPAAYWWLASSPLVFANIGYTEGVGTGDFFGITASSIILASSYVSGTALSSTLTFGGRSFSDLGLIDGTYVWSLSNQETVTMTIETATVPLPAGLPLLLAGLGALGLAARRHRSATKA